jgi:flagellar basal body P-ring formation protein FlgA
MPKASIVRRRTALAALLGASPLLAGITAPPTELQPLSGIVAAAEAQVRSQLRGVTYEVHLQAQEPDSRLHLARCPRPLSTAPLGSGEFGPRVTVRVSCITPPAAWALYVPVNLESDITVLVLRQTQARGARLAGEDVAAESRRVAGLGSAYLGDVAALAHRTLARNLPAGTALTADLFQADYVVRQGQAVTVVAALPGIEVRAPGRALEDAREGTRVRVQNLASQKIVQGVVDGSGIVYATP